MNNPDKIELLETIKVQQATIYNIEYHNKRLNRTHKELFGIETNINLEEYLVPPIDTLLYRCRLTYTKNMETTTMEYIPYIPQKQTTFHIIESNIDYSYKYANRDNLNALKEQYPNVDDIIIANRGELRDTTIANIAFFDGEIWWTPQKPLLEGTMREYLLQKGKLQKKNIQIDEISHYYGFAVMNAMVGFKVINTPIIRS
jgi:4-amino-4-deoxychorismate lyase